MAMLTEGGIRIYVRYVISLGKGCNGRSDVSKSGVPAEKLLLIGKKTPNQPLTLDPLASEQKTDRSVQSLYRQHLNISSLNRAKDFLSKGQSILLFRLSYSASVLTCQWHSSLLHL